jgi:uncharacterized protein (DUF2147 family)
MLLTMVAFAALGAASSAFAAHTDEGSAQGANTSATSASSPVGYWTTIDDDGKTPSSVIQIYPKGKKLFGKIVQLINPREKDPKCTECEGARKNQRIIGMEILRDFEQDDDEWSGGYILDPRNGTEYKCYMELIEGGKRLKVRGYVGIALLGRTQYWQKAAAPR